MKIKKFIANDYKTAIKQAKDEMGSDAIILQTRQIKAGGFLGFFAKPKVEVTIAIDSTLQVNTDRHRKNLIITESLPEIASSVEKEKNKEANDLGLQVELSSLKSMMEEIKMHMHEIELIKGISEEVLKFHAKLIENNVDKEIALKIARSVESRLPKSEFHDEKWIKEILIHTLQQHINDIKPIETKSDKKGVVVFFIGPTGVGKTTTIAKLAANIALIDKKDVALITLDTYRISAAEQLRTFAEIIDIPINVVFEPLELQQAILDQQNKDIIFVDTAGRSPYNSQHMEELKQFIEIAKPDETILVLSVITDSSELINIYQKFSIISVDKLIFTKLDETNNYGQILNTIYEIKKPIAYLTNGQNVPDDIKVPDSLYLAKMLLGKDEAL